MRKLTIEFVREQFEIEGYILLSKKYIGSNLPLDYVCSKGHTGRISWDNWKQGHRCAECSGNKKPVIGFIKKEFKKENYILLTKDYINCSQRLEYICPKKHKRSVTWRDWQQGHRCSECFGNKKLTIEFIKEEFFKKGYILISTEYRNNKQSLEYVCPKGHCSSMSWDNWNHGNRCNICYRENNFGENHPNWNPNLTDRDREDRRLISKLKNWANQVKERDNFTCRICGDKKGGNLVSHHIESYTANPELRIELSNGTTLCEKCHKDFHHQYGYGNNTRKQFEEFISRRVECE